MTATTQTVDLAAVKRGQQAMWASGDFGVIAALIHIVAERLVDTVDPAAGTSVLDVAGGTGNAAIAAARAGGRVTCTDYVPELLERGRERAAAERLEIAFETADAEALPYADASYDTVVTVFGSMFAPDQAQAAAELLRVCKPGGKICIAAWTPDGYSAETIRLMSRHQPPPPTAVPPSKWGEEAYIKTLFGPAIRSIQSTRRTNVMRFVSPEAHIEFFRAHFGPAIAAFKAVGPEGEKQLEADMAALDRKYDRNKLPNGPIAIPSSYLETVIVRD